MTDPHANPDAPGAARPDPELSFLQARILAVLVEKRLTVPDTYPLTLNALVSGCNQKTSRDPVIETTEPEVREAIDALRRMSLVIESSGGRAMRYAENVKRVYAIPTESVSLLATLTLRGPQTSAELRLHCERMQRFSDLSAVEGFLEELASRAPRPLARLLPRKPGTRESRWIHLLVPPETDPSGGDRRESSPGLGFQADHPAGQADTGSGLEQRVHRLEQQIAELYKRLDHLEQTRGSSMQD